MSRPARLSAPRAKAGGSLALAALAVVASLWAGGPALSDAAGEGDGRWQAGRPAETELAEEARIDARPASTEGITPSFRAGRAAATDSAAVRAFLRIAGVLQSPRCQNCHPAGDSPLQTDAGTPHAMLVTRGADGRGAVAMRCSGCHMRANNPQPHAPPGAPNWHLPPPATPMVFEGRTPAQICRQVKDPAQNGNKSMDELFHHLTADSLVLWGWNPGPGRTLPPLSHDEFVAAVRAWYDGGNTCPE